jgi:hypothetical protein
MNNNWTEEQTKESIKKQRKAIYLVIPITIILVSLAFYAGVKMIYNEDYYMQFELLVSEGHLDADFTQYEYHDFCSKIWDTELEEKFSHICFWID